MSDDTEYKSEENSCDMTADRTKDDEKIEGALKRDSEVVCKGR